MNKVIIITALLFVGISGNVLAKKKLYKWVDEEGQVHYSDRVPADQIKKKHEELSEQGVVLEKIENARTKEEFAAERDRKSVV